VSYRRALPRTVSVSWSDVMSLEVCFNPVPPYIDRLSRFWRSLRNYTGNDTANQAISLPSGMTWLMQYGTPSTLFVRKAYLDLVDIIFGQNTANEDRKYCVTGTPGTGKACFCYFLLYWCAKNNRRVVVSIRRPSVYLTFNCESDQVDASQTVPLDLLGDPLTIWLADAVAPDPAYGPTVLTTSPNKEIYQDFIRRGASYLYMPVWTLDELRSCKRLCNMRVTDEEIVARFNMSVSIPRSLAIPCGQFWR